MEFNKKLQRKVVLSEKIIIFALNKVKHDNISLWVYIRRRNCRVWYRRTIFL